MATTNDQEARARLDQLQGVDRWQRLADCVYMLDNEADPNERRLWLTQALAVFPQPVDPQQDFEGYAVSRLLQEMLDGGAPPGPATCGCCGRDMAQHVACTGNRMYLHKESGKSAGPIAYPADAKHDCADCACPPGTFHHAFCQYDLCPHCGGQAIGCGCGGDDGTDPFAE